VHPRLKGRLSSSILSAIRENPAVFDMSLKRQLEVLILQPARTLQSHPGSTMCPPISIIIDGVDECGEAGDSDCSRSKQHDQIEVLSLLLQAITDPAFPFRVVVASRPETWIRRFFAESAPGKFTEIFLDDKYSPNDDILLFLKFKFAEICRRWGLDPSTWPSERAINKLVEDASGQFIYAATVLRFIDTAGNTPQAQLDIVLKIRPRDASNPFSVLDALYTSILRSSPSPEATVLWLKAVQLFRFGENRVVAISAWTSNRLLESDAGQAQALLGSLPSLIHDDYLGTTVTDSQLYGRKLLLLPSILPSVGRNTTYAFYHKSFLDYLGDNSRCGAVFPGIGGDRVIQWIQERVAKTLRCKYLLFFILCTPS
jgi:hypothetical protein